MENENCARESRETFQTQAIVLSVGVPFRTTKMSTREWGAGISSAFLVAQICFPGRPTILPTSASGLVPSTCNSSGVHSRHILGGRFATLFCARPADSVGAVSWGCHRVVDPSKKRVLGIVAPQMCHGVFYSAEFGGRLRSNYRLCHSPRVPYT